MNGRQTWYVKVYFKAFCEFENAAQPRPYTGLYLTRILQIHNLLEVRHTYAVARFLF